MIIARSLINDDVIIAKITELQVQFLDALTATHNISTDFLIDNNAKSLETATDEEAETIRENVAQIEKNQKNRLLNIDFYEKQIAYLQSVLAKKDGFIEINENIKPL